MFLVVLGLCCPLVMLAQTVSASPRGSIVGSVKDPSGAVISSAKLTLVNIATSANVKATADSNGELQLLQLTRAVYSLSAEAAAFKPGNHCYEILPEPTLTEGNQKVGAKQSQLLSPLFFCCFVSKIAALCHILPDISVTVAGLGGDQ